MLSEDHITTISDLSQYHDCNHSIEDESKAAARELLTNETNIFDVGPPPVYYDIVKDILAGKDQPYPTFSPSNTTSHQDTFNSDSHFDKDDSSISIDSPEHRRRDSIMAPDQASTPNDTLAPQDADKQEESAAQRVFGTYELLERILLHLITSNEDSSFRKDITGLKTVLLSQRVNKTFHHIIKRSTKLQENLFFTYKASTHSHFEIAWNPFLQHSACKIRGWDMLSDLDSRGFIQIEPQGVGMGDYFTIPSPKNENGMETWRRMFVCQGEPLDMQLSVNPTAPNGEDWWCPQLAAGVQTTMGQIWDKVKREREWKLQ